MRCAQIRHRAFFKNWSISKVSEGPGVLRGYFWGLATVGTPIGSLGRCEACIFPVSLTLGRIVGSPFVALWVPRGPRGGLEGHKVSLWTSEQALQELQEEP